MPRSFDRFRNTNGQLHMARPLRGALVGYGFIAENGHAPEYQRLGAAGIAQIGAIADVTPSRREAAALAFPHARLYENHLDLLANESRDLDFGDITTPPYP